MEVRTRSDRGGGSLRLWPPPPGRWRQPRAGSAGAGPGRRRRAAERGWSSFGPPSSRWSAVPRLDWLLPVTWADGPVREPSSRAEVLGDSACVRPGLEPAPEAGAGPARPLACSPWSGCHAGGRVPGTGRRPARPGPGGERGCPRAAWGVLRLPPGGLRAPRLSDPLRTARGRWARSGSICTTDDSRLKANTLFV